ncbi:amidohydrolase family protein [Herbaspirillum sp. GCM10030257]|uniref:amidohydrolase family protein n=1 Tax=Herbaspirillum sp. GCM10030257 TaxID=3273393 RepID=UPI00361E4B38
MKTIVRGRSLIKRAVDRYSVEEIHNGALLQENGVIKAIDTFAKLREEYPDAEVIGSGNEIVIPGFVNAHHHVGLTPVQLGSKDMPLELWWITRMVFRDIDIYLDTLYSAFEMIASGVTTVQHLHGWIPGTPEHLLAKSTEVLKAYQDIGMRASYSYTVRDQNRLMYQPDEALTAALPPELQGPMKAWFARFKTDLNASMQLFRQLYDTYHSDGKIKIQLAPANLHWCTDEALEAFSETSKKYNVPIHMHLVETAYQKEYAKRRGGGSAVDYLDRFDLLSPRMTLGHGTWLSEKDIEHVASKGVCVCHNCSSNFRLRSGIAPLNAFEAHGVNTGIGMDEAGINDDRDMLQEMRLVLRAHRVPGMVDDDVPTTAQVFRMATSGGARTTAFADSIGTLEVGKAADLVLLDWDQIAYPYLDQDTSTIDALIQRAKTQGVKLTMCGGEVLYQDGEFTKVNRAEVLKQIHEKLNVPLTEAELARRALSKGILPYIRDFYKDYFDKASHEPFYRMNSRV